MLSAEQNGMPQEASGKVLDMLFNLFYSFPGSSVAILFYKF